MTLFPLQNIVNIRSSSPFRLSFFAFGLVSLISGCGHYSKANNDSDTYESEQRSVISDETNKTPTRAIFDVWSLVQKLEESKAFAAFAQLLDELLNQYSKQVRGSPTDPEGVVYVLDDLAELYSSGLLNFELALAYNKQAVDEYQKLRMNSLDNIPVSNYFNPRRSLYYYFYPLIPRAASSDARPLDPSKGENYFYRRKDLATTFSLATLNSVRETDLQAVEDRLTARQQYLETKLGLISESQPRPHGTSQSSEDFKHLLEILEQNSVYNLYYKHFRRAQRLWLNHQNGNTIDFSMLSSLCQQALDRPKTERAYHDRDPYSQLLYWLSFANLTTGDLKNGTFQARQFINELDRADEEERDIIRTRREVVGQVVEEERRWPERITLAIAIGSTAVSIGMSVAAISAVMGNSVYSNGVYVFSNIQAYNSAKDAIVTSYITSAAAMIMEGVLVQTTVFLPEDQIIDNIRDLTGGLTLLNLQMARYANQFEQVEFFLSLQTPTNKSTNRIEPLHVSKMLSGSLMRSDPRLVRKHSVLISLLSKNIYIGRSCVFMCIKVSLPKRLNTLSGQRRGRCWICWLEQRI